MDRWTNKDRQMVSYSQTESLKQKYGQIWTRQKIRIYVTLGNVLPRQNIVEPWIEKWIRSDRQIDRLTD